MEPRDGILIHSNLRYLVYNCALSLSQGNPREAIEALRSLVPENWSIKVDEIKNLPLPFLLNLLKNLLTWNSKTMLF